MSGAKQDLESLDALGMGPDETRMSKFLDQEEPESVHPTRPPVPEAEDKSEEEVITTYSEEEQEKEREQEEEKAPTDELPVEEEVVDEDPVYLVRMGTTDVEVPLSELVQGYHRTADYTKKTQQLSNERKEFETEMGTVRAERERNVRLFEQGEQWLKTLTPDEPNWAELRVSDPAEYAAQMAEHQHRKDQLRMIDEERMTLQQKQFADNQRALAEHLKGERDRLQEALPEWKDPDVAQTEMNDMAQTGMNAGYTPDELDQVNDHRAVVLLRKAMLYDRIQAGKPQVIQRARKAPVLRPGAAPSAIKRPAPSRLTRAREALKKTGSPKAAEAFFFEALQQEE